MTRLATARRPHRRAHSRRMLTVAATLTLLLAGVVAALVESPTSPQHAQLVVPDGDASVASTGTSGSTGSVAATRPVVATTAGGSGATTCADGFTPSPTAGCARRVADGLVEVAQPDGEVVTVAQPHAHGSGDEGTGPFAATSSWAMDDVGRRPVVCAPTDSPRTVAVYAHRSGRAQSLSTVRSAVRSVVERSNALLAGSARASGGPAADLRFACDSGGAVAVTSLVVPGAEYGTIRQAAVDAGLDAPHEKYLVFADLASPDPAVSGMAQRYDDDRRTRDNHNNGVAAMHGVVWDGHWNGVVPLHELTHMMGGIQPSAPGSDGAGHCTDGRDLMCSSYERSHCDDYAYDCGHDSYFSTAPATGSYLATHWNVGWTGNRFVDVVGEGFEEPEPTDEPEPTPTETPRPDEDSDEDSEASGSATDEVADTAVDVAVDTVEVVTDAVPLAEAGAAGGDLVTEAVGPVGRAAGSALRRN